MYLFDTFLTAECRRKLYSLAVRERKSWDAATLLGPQLQSQKAELYPSYRTEGLC